MSSRVPVETELSHFPSYLSFRLPKGVPLLQAAMRATVSEGEEDPGSGSQAQGMNKPGVILLPGFPSSQFTEHSPFRPLVRLGLEPRLVLECPGEVEESRGKGPFAWGGPKNPTQDLKMCKA